MSLDFKRDIQRSDFRINDIMILPTRDVLLVKNKKHALEPLVMDLLCILAEQPGQVIMRSELIDRLWDAEHGGDESLTRAISMLRKTLRTAGASEDFIETIPKRGYRLRHPVLNVDKNELQRAQKLESEFQENKGSLLPVILIFLIVSMPLFIIAAMKI